ncbi:MAG: hypothetical protein D6732_21665 [Methanobacteriota archaeon]|nr:MAG: hypothetical protein D6732_21665 [Euryarchaeota archaeon]
MRFVLLMLLLLPIAVQSQPSVMNEPEVPWGINAIGAPDVWEQSLGKREIVVAVIDTGVDYLHPDLKASIWNNTDEILNGLDDDDNGYVDDIRGWNFFDGNNDPMDLFPSSHGTHVAGVIAASLNGLGVVGVALNVTVMPLKVFGTSNTEGAKGLADAIRYAIDNGAWILSMSLGSAGVSMTVRKAIEEAWEAGLLLVSATGNSGSSFVEFPAALPEVIAVSALWENLTSAGFSNRGSSNEISAPGVRINSTVRHNASYESVLTVNSTVYQSNWVVNASEHEISGFLVDGGQGFPDELEDVEGKIVLLQRGALSIEEKLTNVAIAGAIGAIVYNDLPGRFYSQVMEPMSIPAVTISGKDGELFSGLLLANNSLSVDLNVRRVSYGLLSGTSMAVPHVSGAAALIWSLNMSLSNAEVRTLLNRGTIDAGKPGPDSDYGFGRLNVSRAVSLLKDSSFPELHYTVSPWWNRERSRVEIDIFFEALDDMGIFSVEVVAINGSGISLHAPVQYNSARTPSFSGNMTLVYPEYLGNVTLRLAVEDLRGHKVTRDVPVVVYRQEDMFSVSVVSQVITLTELQTISSRAGLDYFFVLVLILQIGKVKRRRSRLN